MDRLFVDTNIVSLSGGIANEKNISQETGKSCVL